MRRRRVKDQEVKARKREVRQKERMERLESVMFTQHEKLDRLEDLVHRAMHRDRVRLDTLSSESGRILPTRSETGATIPVQHPARDDLESMMCKSTCQEPISSI